jgi:hypothetical protein
MSQKLINVGTVANDGTGDTIRGAFSNVNANFTEVYNNISNVTATISSIDSGQNNTILAAYTTANAAYTETNTVNSILQTTATSVNAFSTSVGSSANAYAAAVGVSANAYAVTVGTSSNLYTSVLSANNAVGANAWANAVGVASNNWSLSTFTTLSNTALIFNTTNASFSKANTAFQNTTGTFSGNLNISGTATALGGFSDAVGPVRERFTFTVSGNTTANSPHTTYIANNTGMMYVKILDDNLFSLTANIGSTVDIYQLGSGNTKIIANDAAVTVYSSNNWANIAGQYLTATAVKVLANTWILTGDLKA